MAAIQIKEKTYAINGINLNVAEAGSAHAPIILFLHGFPEFWYGWHKQMQYFAQKGFRVVAPDQRGYNLSSKPAGVQAYTLENLVTDIVVLIKILSPEKITLVGHDWGGAVAWTLAMHYPHLLHRLIILNMPHPKVMHNHLRKNPKQMLKSWYAGFFQIPKLPELLSSALDFKILSQAIFNTANPNTFSAGDKEKYKTAWQQPGALTAMINWYRAFKYNSMPANAVIPIPTLLMWGKLDTFLESEMAAPSIAKCTQGKLIYLPNATHWLHHEMPEEVNNIIAEFIQFPQ